MSRPRALAPGMPVAPGWLVFLGGALFAVGLGVTVGAPADPLARAFVIVIGVGLLLWIVQRPEAVLGAILVQTIIFPTVPISLTRGLNPLDFLLAPALLGAWIWHRNALAGEDPASAVVLRRRGLVRWTIAFYGVAVLTLVLLAARGHAAQALDSTLLLLRALEGASVFFLVSRLARTPRDLRIVRNSLVIGVLIAVAVNLVAVFAFHVPRAGAVWVFGTPTEHNTVYWALGDAAWAVTNPNELAGGVLLAWVVVLAMPMKNRWLTLTSLAAGLWLIVATLSRSGVLGWIVFLVAYGLAPRSRFRKWMWVLPVALVLVVIVAPQEYRLRMLRTLVQERGTFEVYTSVVRVFGWHAAIAMFLAHPILGVGYLGFRFVSADYNALGLALGQAESFYLETATGMGIVGLAVLTGWVVAFLKLAGAVRRQGPPGSPAHELGAIAPAFLLGLATQNLTGDNLVGLMAVSQLAAFTALLAQAGRIQALETP